MSDRLKELQRQRALAQEQLAWLDREIAREAGVTPTTPAPVPVAAPVAAPVSAPAPVASSATASRSPVDAEKILERYTTPSGSIHNDVRKGCFLYFFTALAIVGLAAVALYFAFRRPV